LPRGVTLIAVDSAAEMKQAVLDNMPQADVLVMAAAVADYRPAATAAHKIKKSDDDLVLPLARTDDITIAVAEVRGQTGWPRCVVGFAAETQNLLENAAGKLKRKSLDLIVANDVSRSDAGFAVDTNLVTILASDSEPQTLPLLSKVEVADAIWDRVLARLES
jgi:phosphopantothenoylcysteine decarboxylase/phosphopantothenate--cysteine ligase